jgi:cell wall-associated NlpC family hydrolase
VKAAVNQVQADRLDEFLGAERAQYGVAPPLRMRSGRVVGAVVTRRQAKRLEDRVGDASRVVVLEDAPDTLGCEGYGRVTEPAAVYASPARTCGKLATEVLEEDPPFRRLSFPRQGERELVQLCCGTLGWLETARVETASAAESERRGAALRRSTRGLVQPIERSQLWSLLSAVEALAERGVRYRLGGRDDRRALDCSGFTQLLVQRHLSLLLPRHALDQSRCGLRRGRAATRAGDLLFATAHGKNTFHVGLVLEGGWIAHACLARGALCTEPLESFHELYRFRGARQIGALS